jgi:alpha-tubulin suppressor-like RCC1 family protein
MVCALLGVWESMEPWATEEVTTSSSLFMLTTVNHGIKSRQEAAFISKANALYMCGSGSKGQLGLGDKCEGDVFNVVKVLDGVNDVACGESHTLIISSYDKQVLVCGANDKF